MNANRLNANPSGIARYALMARVVMLIATSFTVILTTRTLGASGQGDWALLQFGLLLVTGLAGFVAGGAVVYVRKFFSARQMLPLALAGIATAMVVGAWLGSFTGWVPPHWQHDAMWLGGLQAAVIFMSQLHLAAGNVRYYHLTQVVQVVALAAAWGVMVGAGLGDMEHLVSALRGSLTMTLGLLILQTHNVWTPMTSGKESVHRLMLTKGAEGQTGSLLQLLTNRLNLSQLERFVSLDASGLYSLGYYSMEAVWTVGRAFAPAVHAEAARTDDPAHRRAHTMWHVWRVLGLSSFGAVMGIVLPDSLWEAIFQVSGLRSVLVALAPAMVAGGVASILSHHLSGVGLHRWNAITSAAGLATLWGCSVWWIPGSAMLEGAVMAGWAMSCAAVVQCTGLAWAFHRATRAA